MMGSVVLFQFTDGNNTGKKLQIHLVSIFVLPRRMQRYFIIVIPQTFDDGGRAWCLYLVAGEGLDSEGSYRWRTGSAAAAGAAGGWSSEGVGQTSSNRPTSGGEHQR